MNARWAAAIVASDWHLAAQLRSLPRIEVCALDDRVWFRSDATSEPIENCLRRLPGAWRFEVLGDGQLRPIGRRVPQGQLPAGPWQALADWLELELPRVAIPESRGTRSLPDPVALKLVRSVEPCQATALLATCTAWAAYGDVAPRLRLERCSFALDGQGRCLIRGEPLPPMAGIHYVDQQGIFVPAGWTWSPSVDAAVVREVLGLADGDSALLTVDGSWELIDTADWVRATRSAIRLSTRPLSASGGAHGG